MDREKIKAARADVIKAVEELAADNEGISFECEEGSGYSEETRKRYGDSEDRLPVDDWGTLRVYYKTQEEMHKIAELAQALRVQGYCFDTGGMLGGNALDWELDWSFRKEDR